MMSDHAIRVRVWDNMPGSQILLDTTMDMGTGPISFRINTMLPVGRIVLSMEECSCENELEKEK